MTDEDRNRRECERRLQALWERAAAKAAAEGFPPEAVASSMFAAAFGMLLRGHGPAVMAAYLDRIAGACHERAGGAADDDLPTLN
jgi:hypothetical protein